MKLNVEKVFSSSTLPRTMTMAGSTSFRYFDNLSTTMALEAKCPHNLIVGLQLGNICKTP
jgi:hypothetical protein